jgi:hypothetical protein
VDPDNPAGQLRVSATATIGKVAEPIQFIGANGDFFQWRLGPVNYPPTRIDVLIAVTVTAADPAGNAVSSTVNVTLFAQCTPG